MGGMAARTTPKMKASSQTVAIQRPLPVLPTLSVLLNYQYYYITSITHLSSITYLTSITTLPVLPTLPVLLHYQYYPPYQYYRSTLYIVCTRVLAMM